ncbi:MAG: redoxin domain-containing protein, partial [Chloroflexi bacterium]|nr:redoxin domain-containing protein [Chloroflexota bacterium]
MFVVIVAYSFTRQSGDTLGAQPIGHAAPAFSLPLYDGKSLSLADLKGKPVVGAFYVQWRDVVLSLEPFLYVLGYG